MSAGTMAALLVLAGGAGDAEEAARVVARKAFLAWAGGETSAAFAEFGALVERFPKTHWATLAVYVQGRIAGEDRRNYQTSMRAFRTAANRDPGSPESIAAQTTLGLAYEEAGELAQAFKEYAQVAGLKLAASSSARGSRWAERQLPLPRNPFEDPRALAGFAAERCAVLFTFLGPRLGPPPSRPGELPAREARLPSSVVVLRTGLLVQFPLRRREPFYAKSDPEVTFLIAGKDSLIAEVELVAVARVRSSGGVRERRHWMLSALPVDEREEEATVLTGGSTAFERRIAAIRLRTPRRCVRVSLSGEAAEFRGWGAKLVRTVRAGAARGGKHPSVDEVALAADGDGFVAVWSDPGSREDILPVLSSDLFRARSRDGLSWGAAEKARVSRGMGERQPCLLKTTKGLWYMVWASSMRGWGYSDVYVSSSADGRAWRKPRRLKVPPEMLKTFSSKYHVTFQAPVLEERDEELRLTFVATGSVHDVKTSGAREWKVCASAVYSIKSKDGLIWSKPALVFSTRERRLSTFRPAPTLLRGQTEEIAGTARPYGIEIPGRLAARAWLTNCGRLMLTASSRGRKATKCLVGSGVTCAKLLRGAEGTILLYTLDSGEMYCMRARDGISFRSSKRIETGAPVAGFDALTVGPDRLLLAWPESPGMRNSRLLSRLVRLPAVR